MTRVHHFIEGIFFLALGIIMIWAGVSLDAQMLFLLAVLFFAIGAFFFYRSFAGRRKDKDQAEDLRRRIAEIGKEDPPGGEKNGGGAAE
jgi:membrane protein implicated in regulation of membrane protease activity